MTQITQRIEDAKILYGHAHFEGTLLMLLIAIAAAAEKRYPKMGDREKFVTFLKEERQKRHPVKNFNVMFRGKMRDLDYVFYKWMRCSLVHEGGLPEDIQFEGDQHSISVADTGLVFGKPWFDTLADCALES